MYIYDQFLILTSNIIKLYDDEPTNNLILYPIFIGV